MERHALTPLESKAQAPSEAPAAGGIDAATPDGSQVEEALVAQARERRLARPPQRWAALDDKRVLNTSGMLQRRNLFTRMLSHLAFRKVGFDERHVRTIRDQDRDADLVYVMNHQSLLDFLYFNYAFLRVGLPLVYFANKISMVPFRPLLRMALYGLRRLFRYYKHRLEPSERLAYGLERGRPALLFLRTRTLWPWAPEKLGNAFLETIIEAQRERIAAAGPDERPRPIHVVPQLLVWTLNPDRYQKSFWTTVFGNPEAPGRLRKVINFLLNRRRAFVQVGKPIDLVEFLAAQRGDESLADLARALRFTIHQGLSIEERVIRGPVLKRSRRIREEILDSPRVKGAISAVARQSGGNEKALTKEIRGYLKEMAADFSMKYVEFMCMAMTIIFARLYSELVIDSDGLEKVREAGRQAPLVLLPCHRSHVDYLVISYIFYVNGLISPHIAAGKNLNFFPIGKIFRRSGAFFLRRSFKNNPRYALAFREYLRKLVKEGYWIEFFIEGGRSRTGKMLPPKFGMLKIIVDAIRDGAAKDVYLVPIYVGYEQVIEEGAFTRELRGGEKKKENITALLNATQVLWSKYGRLYVNFADPISCREALDRVGLADDDPDASAGDAFLRTLGYRVSHGINSVAMVTPSSLVASALLFHDKRGAALSTILGRVGFLLELAQAKGARLSRTLEHALKIHRQDIVAAKEELAESGLTDQRLALGERSPVARARGEAVQDAIAEALGNWQKNAILENHVFGEDDVVWAIDPAHRINLDFYKNNIVHLLVPEAIVATAVRSTMEMGSTTVARVMEGAAFLSRTFQYEFVFDPDRGFAQAFGETLQGFEGGGLIRRTPGEDFSDVGIVITERGADTLALFHRVMLPWIEAYWLLATSLDRQGSEPISQATLIKESQTVGEHRFRVGDVTCTEASSSVTFSHALNAYAEFGFLERTRKGRERIITCAPAEDGEGPFAELAERLRTYFA